MKTSRRVGIDDALSELLLNEGYSKVELAHYLETTPEAIDAVLMDMAEIRLVQTLQRKLICYRHA